MKSQLQLIVNDSELGAGTRGASLGYLALMMVASEHEKEYRSFLDLQPLYLDTYNDLLRHPTSTPKAKYIDGIVKVYDNLSKHITSTVDKGAFPLIVSGDHSSAGGTIRGIKQAYPGKRLGVIWIDAHGDLHTPKTSPSGNVHGMPLATALHLEKNIEGEGISDHVRDQWKQMHGEEEATAPHDLVFFGVRDTEIEEDILMRSLGIRNITVEELRQEGVKRCAEIALDRLSDCDIIYISFDVDSLDSSISEGTGTPVINGFSRVEVDKLLYYLLQSEKLVCFEMVEINPLLDTKGNVMAEEAMKIFSNAIDYIQR